MTEPKDLTAATRHLAVLGYRPLPGATEPQTDEQRRLRQIKEKSDGEKAALSR